MAPGDIVVPAFRQVLVLLSFLIAFLGAYVALIAVARIRASAGNGENWGGYVAIAAISMGGVGIWGMHFIGMQAQRMPFEVGYGLWPTLLSLAMAVAFSGFAFWYVGRAPFSLARCLVGGLFAGLAVAIMHYIGIGAMRMPAVFQWRVPLVAASVGIAVVAATAALWLAFNVQREWQRLLAAGVMAVAVCGMHYTGAAAGIVVCTAPRAYDDLQVGGTALPYAAFIGAAGVLAAMRWLLYRSQRRYRARLAVRVDGLIDAAVRRGVSSP
ncbi:MHYT domain-containing protein [Bordetella sp. 2513F-2]